MKICFATNNRHKIDEIQKILGDSFEILSLDDIGCTDELPETTDTLEGNSKQKAEYVWKNFGIDCFADDTGLEVRELNNAPGVFSARYAGPSRNDDKNMDLLLQRLHNTPDRKARFRTVVTLVIDGEFTQFEGIVNGHITHERIGNGGFGYDPIFTPDGFEGTFAQMSTEEKNSVSHRGRAIRQLVNYLEKSTADLEQ
ncbi:non-canonical purine NTP diphosphatase [Flammeovirgaceae bacterium SG7u.111]|nr:non-canonical purine NTP diphosphatase [Flammeovirgaceae bacterium SG7u.132]WPO34788.1 non-canonical purine NTP diphosphatase [Flammeovirgaceae bacterium SG7u.111]